MAQRAASLTMPTGVEIHGNYVRINFSYKGKRHRESLGLSPTKQNINFARLKRETILYEIKIGTFNYSAHFPNSKHADGQPKSSNVSDLAKRFLEHKSHDVRRSTLQRYEWVLRDFVNIYGKNRSCSTLSPRSLMEYRNEILKGKAGRTVNRNFVTVNAFLSWLHKMEYVTRDLSDVLTRAKESPADIQPFSMEEMNKILNCCYVAQHKNMITIFLYTGIRTSELCTLAWEDVDFKNKTLHVRRSAYNDRGLKTTKTDTERFVDLMPPAIEALKAQRHLTYLLPQKEYQIEQPGNSFKTERLRFIFNPKVVRAQKGSDFDYYGSRSIRRLWRELCTKACVEYRNQYQLRHTYASWMITHANVNVSYLAQQMGHADITMVAKVYGKWLIESNKKESDRVWHELEKLQTTMP